MKYIRAKKRTVFLRLDIYIYIYIYIYSDLGQFGHRFSIFSCVHDFNRYYKLV